jgi:hypothetical protein
MRNARVLRCASVGSGIRRKPPRVKKPPETWFWSHDIRSTQIDAVLMPGARLMRLASYGEGAARRFAALIYRGPGPVRSYALDLDAPSLAARLREAGARPVAITAGDADAQFCVVLETGPGPLASLHVDLDADQLRGLIDEGHGIADLATYVAGGARRFAAIVEERSAPSWLFVGQTAADLDRRVVELDAALVRVRGYVEAGVPRFAAVAERARGTSWAWYTDLDGDGVARQLEANRAYPVDLDAVRDARGVRFTVVMVRDRQH